MLESIDGRVHDVIVAADGKLIPGEFFPHLVKDVEGIEAYQFWQGRKGELVFRVVDLLMENEKLLVLLVPHVFTPSGNVESDPEACRQVYGKMQAKYPNRIFSVQGTYDQSEIKYLIGRCDFFIGSRMHSCIAAMSQGIPAIGLAYSKKFQGVFRSVGAEQSVIDMRQLDSEEILRAVTESLQRRQVISERLGQAVPEVRDMISSILRDVQPPANDSES